MCSYSLDQKEHHVCRYGVFKVRADRVREKRHRRAAVSQNSTAWHVEVDVVPGEPRHRTIVEATDRSRVATAMRLLGS